MKTKYFLVTLFSFVLTVSISAQSPDTISVDCTEEFFLKNEPAIYEIKSIYREGVQLVDYNDRLEPVLAFYVMPGHFCVQNLVTREVEYGEEIIPTLENVELKFFGKQSQRTVIRTKEGMLATAHKVIIIFSTGRTDTWYHVSLYSGGGNNKNMELFTYTMHYLGPWK